MELFFAMGDIDAFRFIKDRSKFNMLNSFEYKQASDKVDIHELNMFIADSGAFTAMASGKKIDEKYIDAYIDWINNRQIDHFVEMDLDEIVGYENVLKIRKNIESRTGKQPMPVWHLGRGQEGWLDMVNNYPYVCLSLSGYTASSKWLIRHNFKPLSWFLDTASKAGSRVHALGCTRWELLKKYHFFSADSSAYTLGQRYGVVYEFKDGKMRHIKTDRKFKKDAAKISANNTIQWLEAMQYARTKM